MTLLTIKPAGFMKATATLLAENARTGAEIAAVRRFRLPVNASPDQGED
jgi:hypothetical protein